MSLWTFALLRRLELVIANALGYNVGLVHASIGYEEMGCQIVLVGFFIWIGRAHFKNVVKSNFLGKSVRHPNEPLSYRWAFSGFWVMQNPTSIPGTYIRRLHNGWNMDNYWLDNWKSV